MPSPGNSSPLGSVLAGYVVLKLMDREVLGGNDPADEVSNREHSNNPSALEDRQVPAALIRHALHALIYRGPKVHGDGRAGHDLADSHFLRRTPVKDYLARVIAFGNESIEVDTVHDDKSSDSLVSHPFQRLVDGYTRGDGVDL